MKLKPICTFQGGKQRLAKKIVDEMLSVRPINEHTVFYDICCGSGAISVELVNRGICPSNIVMVDISVWGEFWQLVGNSNFSIFELNKELNSLPNDISKIQAAVKNLSSKNEYSVYTYLILQAASFGGKQIWWENNKWVNASYRNYWTPTEESNRQYPVNPMMPMPETLLSRARLIEQRMAGVKSMNICATKIISQINKYNSIIYIDPPYKNTTKYSTELDIDRFLSDLFYQTMSPIFVSEASPIGDNAVLLSPGRKKGGISGNRGLANEEWLSVFI